MKRIAMISEHASPLAMLGGVDSGGQNVYVGQLARHLAALGYEVDVFTRRDSAGLPEVAEWVSGEPQVREPTKVETWDWYSVDALPAPLFAMLPTAIEALRTGRTCWDLP